MSVQEELPFGDEGAGPEEPEAVINDPINQEAAAAIRASTLEPADSPGPAPDLVDPEPEPPEAEPLPDPSPPVEE
jgi:hypothetical protein